MTGTIHYRRNRLISHPKLRKQVFQRDHGRCALCNRDCEALRKRLRALGPEERRLERLRLGIPETQSWTWEIDHVTPVAEGGTDLPSNLRTLCFVCHPKVTATYAASRTSDRRRATMGTLSEVYG
jgi:5-methylcytosine-specific restriction endonuclease McrA